MNAKGEIAAASGTSGAGAGGFQVDDEHGCHDTGPSRQGPERQLIAPDDYGEQPGHKVHHRHYFNGRLYDEKSIAPDCSDPDQRSRCQKRR